MRAPTYYTKVQANTVQGDPYQILKMAVSRLILSTLKTDTVYSLNNDVPCKRCLIHVKLTDYCMRTVESLIDSEKVQNNDNYYVYCQNITILSITYQGAYFSLWFDESGGVS